MQHTSLVHYLREHANQQSQAVAFTFLDPRTEGREHSITFGALDHEARQLAVALQARTAAGDRVVLFLEPGLSFVSGLLACLYSGTTGVAASPHGAVQTRVLPRLKRTLDETRATLIFSHSTLRNKLAAHQAELGNPRWLLLEDCDPAAAASWEAPNLDNDPLAFIQYTSGSTSQPKGVMLSHGNLIANSHVLADTFQLDQTSKTVIWLPPYHDMGLIGGIIHALHIGYHAVLMSPIAFVRRPLSWLRAISKFRATCSGGPNFAYDLCVEKLDPLQRDSFDLSCWQTAFCGAEPVRASSLRRFAEAFAPSGFQMRAFSPCYGLAESTLMVSGQAVLEHEPVIGRFLKEPLQQGRAVPCDLDSPQGPSLELVSGGRARANHPILLVDPSSGHPCPENQVGEIWVTGPSLAKGYWGLSEMSAQTFAARLERDSRNWLKTGDLAFFHHGELFITGRLKDLLIVRGQNFYPQDIELAAEQAHHLVRTSFTAAFSLSSDDGERIFLAAEAVFEDTAQAAEIIAAVRAAVNEDQGLALHGILLLNRNTLTKTTSGKIQRAKTRDRYLDGSLPIRFQWLLEDFEQVCLQLEEIPLKAEQPQLLVRWLQAWVTRELGIKAVLPTTSLLTYGLDSLQAMTLQTEIESRLNLKLDLELLIEGASINDIIAQITAPLPDPSPPVLDSTPLFELPENELPLTPQQAALWHLFKLAPDSLAYKICRAVRLTSRLDESLLRSSCMQLSARHESLRTRFLERDGQPIQRILVEAPIFETVAANWDEAALTQAVAKRAALPLDPRHDPLFRLTFFRCEYGDDLLLLEMHHLISDFQTCELLIGELIKVYDAKVSGRSNFLPTPHQFRDFIRHQQATQSSSAYAAACAYWQDTLSGELPVLDLPHPKQRPARARFRGGLRKLTLAPALVDQLAILSRQRRSTLFTTLLAGYGLLLQQFASAKEVIVGVPASGRDAAELRDIIGYLINPLPIRILTCHQDTFGELLERVRGRLAAALKHQALPFPEMVNLVQPDRDAGHSPLFQTLFVYYPDGPFANLAQELPTTRPTSLGSWQLAPHPLPHLAAQLDLKVSATRLEGSLSLCCEYDRDLFEPAWIDELLRHFQQLLEQVSAEPDRPLSAAMPLDPETASRLLSWNQTGHATNEFVPYHQHFEAHAAAQPEAIAVLTEQGQLTYGALEHKANQLANGLIQAGLGTDEVVALYLERGLDLAVAVLAVAKAGAAFLALEPEFPTERLRTILKDAQPRLMLTNGPTELHGIVPIHELAALSASKSSRPDRAVYAQNASYLVYTSGTTGRPKGICNSHGGIANRLAWTAKTFELTPADRLLHKTPLSFDVSVWELLMPLTVGASLVMARPGGHRDPAYLNHILRERAVTLVHFVPTMLRVYLNHIGTQSLPALRHVYCSGEPLDNELAATYHAVLSTPLHNLYGPAEAAVDVSAYQSEPNQLGKTRSLPIGTPISLTRLHLLDACTRQVPIGARGELFIAGVPLARSYIGLPQLTALSFVPDPFSPTPGGRLYRTGDLAQRLPDGNIVYLGRADLQVKIGGVRIELAEIEASLAMHPDVATAAVVRKPRADQLVAYLDADANLDLRLLRRYLASQLPSAFVPATIIIVPSLPLNANGKLDRRELSARASKAVDASPSQNALQTLSQERVAQAFSQVLGKTIQRRDDTFFAHGGNSLQAARVISRLQQIYHRELPLSLLFENQSVAAFAAAIDALREGSDPYPPLKDRPLEENYPLTYEQKGLWLFDQSKSGTQVYNMPIQLELRGLLHRQALNAALTELIDRHQVLRTYYVQTGGEVRAQLGEVPTRPLAVTDLSEVAEPNRVAAAWIEREATTPFDLSRAPLIRAQLLCLSAEHHILCLTLHHIVADGWTLGIIARELNASYQQGSTPLPRIQYQDYAYWQHDLLKGGRAKQLETYWLKRLANPPEPLFPLPTDYKPHAGNSIERRLPAELVERAETLSHQQGTTLFITLLAAFILLLSRFTGRKDIVVATDLANRKKPEFEELIGLFTNQVMLRTQITGPRYTDLLAEVHRKSLNAFEHDDLPFTKLASLLPEGGSNLFQAKLVLQNAPPAPIALANLEVQQRRSHTGTAKFDLLFDLTPTNGGLHAYLEYNRTLFQEAWVAELWLAWTHLLDQVLEQPEAPLSTLSTLPATNHRALLRANAYPPQPDLMTLFPSSYEQQTATRPEAIALQSGTEQLSYGALNERANRLARYLKQRFPRGSAPIALLAPRDEMLVIALLAVLKTGAPYLPLDRHQPTARLRLVIEEAGCSAVLTRGPAPAGLDLGDRHLDLDQCELEALSPLNLGQPIQPLSLAYVIYTSGSTGTPKGVAVPHEGLAHYLHWCRHSYIAEVGAETACHSVLSFDLTVTSLLAPLSAGGSVTLITETNEMEKLAELMAAGTHFSYLKLTPAHLKLLIYHLTQQGISAPVGGLVIGGEALEADLLTEWFTIAPQSRTYNEYGPTEAVVGSSVAHFEVDAHPITRPSIGRAVPSAELHVLDGSGQPLASGVVGELYIGGSQLARGYLGRASMTAERFGPDPYSHQPGARLYRTGDRCRYLPDGALDYLGRYDRQVKILGYRIELGEITARLRAIAGVRDAVVTSQDEAIIAYVDAETTLTTEAMRTQLAAYLPDYMLPAVFVAIEAVPHTAHGKVAIHELPEPFQTTQTEELDAPPANPIEAKLLEIWQEVLGRADIGVTDRFYDIGGDSIRAIKVLGKSLKQGNRMELQAILRNPTVRELANEHTSGTPPVEPELATSEPFDMVDPHDREQLAGKSELVDAYPTVLLQLGMIYHSQLSPGMFHDSLSLHLEYDYSPEAFRAALNHQIRSHPILTTGFDISSYRMPLQLISKTATPELWVADLREQGPDQQRKHIEAWLAAEIPRPFELDKPPLIRFALHRRADRAFQLTAIWHHAILDGWSASTFFSTLLQGMVNHIRGEQTPLPEPKTGFKNFVKLEREALANQASRDWWAHHLDGASATDPAAHTETGPPEHANQAVHRVPFPETLLAELRQRARELGLPLKTLLLTVHLRVLAYFCADRNVTTGLVGHGRDETTGGEEALGLFLNTLPLHLHLPDTSWAGLAKTVFAAENALVPHRRYPMARLLQENQQEPLFHTLFNYTDFHVYEKLKDIEGLHLLEAPAYLERLDVPLAAMFSIDPVTRNLQLALFHNYHRYDETRLHHLSRAYQLGLLALASNPNRCFSACALSDGPEWDQKDSEPELEPEPIARAFHRQVHERPEALALTYGDRNETYAQLGASVAALAARLRAHGVGPDDRVLLLTERSLELPIAILAILLAGAAYVPCEPRQPQQRLRVIHDEAAPRLVLTWARHQQAFAGVTTPLMLLDSPMPPAPLCATPVDPDNLSYLLFTSGSTGTPKGILARHGSLATHFEDLDSRLGTAAQPGKWLAVTSYSFDISVVELVWTLTRGYHVHLRGEEQDTSSGLAEQILTHEITHFQCTPSRATLLIEDRQATAALAQLRLFILGGEVLPLAMAQTIRERLGGTLFNIYGPTEATVWTTVYQVPPKGELGATVSIGTPIARTQVVITDPYLNPLPIGVEGELLIRGASLLRGYMGAPGRTAASCLPDPFTNRPGARLYRSGDRCARSQAGLIRYVGRLDQQIKIRGLRVEPGEVEATLASSTHVQEVAVQHDKGTPSRLVAYLVLKRQATPPQAVPESRQPIFVDRRAQLDPEASAQVSEIREQARRYLPAYMIPAFWILMDQLPQTHSGKIDRSELRSWAGTTVPRTTVVAGPNTETERLIATLWQEVLEVPAPGINENFFELGGDSLKIARLHMKLREKLERADLKLVTLFTHPTIHLLALHLDQDGPSRRDRSQQQGRHKKGLSRLKKMKRGRHG